MPPYDYRFTPSSEYQYESPPSSYCMHQPNRPCTEDYTNRDAIISSLVEKLADREAEIRKLSSENSSLENKLKRCKQTIKQETTKCEELENAYEELMERFNEQEEELKVVSQRNDEMLGRQQELEIVCSNLQNAVDVREEDLSVMKNELDLARSQLTHAMDAHSHNRNRDICSLENKLDDLQKEVEFYKIKAHEAESLHYHLSNREMELKSILKENNEMLEEQEKEIGFLTKKNRFLENEGEVQRSMLEEQEKDITSLKEILVKLNNVIKSQDIDLGKKDNTILQLSLDIERYENIVEEAEYVAWEQHRKIKAETQNIEKMSTEIEHLKDELKWERAGVMSFYGCGTKGCGAKA